MRILLAGDTHADHRHVDYLFRRAEYHDCSTVLVLGDFGYWPRSAWGHKFLKRVDDMIDHYGIRLIWLDGNHEDHTALGSLVRTGVSNEEGFIPVPIKYRKQQPDFLYIPRGTRWEWDEVSFLALGGAFSVDRMHRTVGESFFYEEVISDGDVDKAIDGGEKVDVMLTHDVPSTSPILEQLLIRKGRRYKLIEEAEDNRYQVQRVVDAAEPDLLVHGHYHVDYRTRIDGMTIRGLDCNGTTGFSWTVLDTEGWNAEDTYLI